MSLSKYFLLILWALFASSALAQGWEKEFVEEMWPYHMLETQDGGYLISGFFTVEEPGTFVTKINEFGDEGWRINFVEGGGVVLNGRMIRTADNNIVLRVRVKTEVNSSEFVKHKFVKIDEDGNILWETILNATEEEINFIGDFFAEADSSITFPARIGEDNYIGSIDVDGVVTTLVPSPGVSFYPNFSQTPDGRYFYQSQASSNTAVLQETNINGELIAERIFPGRATGELFLEANNDIIIFESYPFFQGLRQLRVDSLNNLIDSDTLWNGLDVESGKTTRMADGFLHTGTFVPNGNESTSILVTKTDFDGNVIWQQNYDHRFGDQTGNRSYATADGGHMTLGIYNPGVATGPSLGPPQDAYVIKSDENGVIYTTKNDQTFVTTTNVNGEYILPIDTGDYVVRLNIPNSYWDPCVNDVTVDLAGFNNTEQINFEVQEIISCPNMTVSGAAPTLRPCVVRPSYINYSNNGTDPALGAYIDINYDPFITPVSSSIPWVVLPNNVYRFELGDVESLAFGNFTVDLMLDCDATVGASYCIEAVVFPDSLCEPPLPTWSGAFLEVNGECQGDDLRFRIENTGDGSMDGPSNYIIVEDVILLGFDSVDFDPGEFRDEILTANGSTYTVIVDQVPDAPGNSFPMAVIEGCGENSDGTFSVGFANQFQFNDADVYQDLDCPIAVNSFDPNDKQGFPIGYKAPHFIQPETPIEYLIRFQNTGTDTAYHVVIRDTLDQGFDLTSLEAGTSSHVYDLEMEGQGILKFTFDNINLPDSIVDLPGSNGFVEFKIRPKGDLPLGTVIRNNAGIYFDLNEPVITNETIHTISQDFIEVISDVVEHPMFESVEISIQPNPFSDLTRIEIKNHEGENIEYLFEIFNVEGKLVRSEKHKSSAIEFGKNELSAGLYFYRLTSDDGLFSSGRILIQ